MPGYLDFQDLKERVPFSQIVPLLGLQSTKRGDNWRSPCPICRAGGSRTLSITEGKGFRCWAGGVGGDIIALVSHVRASSPQEAASFIASATGTAPRSGAPTAPPAPSRKEGQWRAFDPDAYFKELDTAHELIAALGLSPATCERFQCGYRSNGVLAGRLAVRIDDAQGNFLAFIGLPLNEGDELKAPKGFDSSAVVFNCHRIAEGEARMARCVLDVLAAYEQTGEDAICFLTELVEPIQHERLASVQDERKFKVFY